MKYPPEQKAETHERTIDAAARSFRERGSAWKFNRHEMETFIEFPKILVTGATGKTGGAVVRKLLAEGVPVRAVVRLHDAKSIALQHSGAEVVVAICSTRTNLWKPCVEPSGLTIFHFSTLI